MELNNCKKKLKVLFDKFFNENLELSNYVRENLVKQLAESGKRTDNIFETPFFSDLLIYALTNIDKGTLSVKIFITQLVNLLIENELQFCKFVQLQGFTMVTEKVLKTKTVISAPTLVSACFKICSSMICHSTGVYWAVQYRLWKDILSRNLLVKPKNIAVEAYNFIGKLVWKLDEYEEESAITDILKFIVEPIKNNQYPNRVLDADGEEAIYKPLLPFLESLKTILEETNRIIRPNKVVPVLRQYLLIEPVVSILLSVTRDRSFAYILSQIVFRISFAYNVSIAMQNKEEHDLAREITVVYYNVFHELLRKQMPQESVHFTASCFVFWSKFDKNIVPPSFERHGRTYLVEDQFLTILLTPLLTYSCIKNKRQTTSCNAEESLSAFHYKLSTLTEEHIVKAAYSFYAVLEADLSYKKQLAIDTVKRLFEMKSYLSGGQAGVLYQALFYNLQFYTVTDETGALTVGDNPVTCPDDVKLLSLVLEAIKMLLKEHKINWYESVEIISLQNCLMNLLKQNILPIKQLLQALDLIDLSIQQFLSPDLALLIASRRGSTLNEIAAVMSSYLQHPEWEVRDSALHLLLSCTELAYVKYVPMQALLSENSALALAVRAAVYDEETYVQVTALKCLAAATKIESLWALALSEEPGLNFDF
ncbi:uncharacterized protein LOC126369205 isoform X2 [Pectinophora gossypiella]|uniref:uncharacterized protein LOC126369205 isoform X2 n=1 Tax=Pectinophora gossypiella TaxID=13191 RepID=UPI00214E6C2E|nr:uncharacterized protein LOC126369205 isoform X2 [Pectinophora gossypiella]